MIIKTLHDEKRAKDAKSTKAKKASAEMEGKK